MKEHLKSKILEWPLEAFMWVYEIFIYSLAPLLFLGIIWMFGDVYVWFQNFSWFIKIPVCIAVGIYLKSILKGKYFTTGNKLYVGNINIHLTSERLKEIFSNYGKVKNMKHYQDEGFAFIEMASPEEAKKAKDILLKDNIKFTTPPLFVVIV